MYKKKTFKKTVLEVELISESSLTFKTADELANNITDKMCSGRIMAQYTVDFSSEEEVAKALADQGYLATFLLGKEWEDWNPPVHFSTFEEVGKHAAARIQKAKDLGWTDIGFIYDDTAGGLVLAGVSPEGKWGEVPFVDIEGWKMLNWIDVCRMSYEVEKVFDKANEENEYGVSFYEFIETQKDELVPLVQAMWDSTKKEERIKLLTKHALNLRAKLAEIDTEIEMEKRRRDHPFYL